MAQSFMPYSMPLEVYFDTAVLRGILVTNQDRLSNHLTLREGEETFSLREATLEDNAGTVLAQPSSDYLVYMQHVSLIADLSPQLRASRAEFEHLYVKKDPKRAVVGVGRYWLEGDVHLIPGSSMHELLMARTRFLPITKAIFLDGSEKPPRTFLLNRTMITCISAPKYAQG
jgi:hypothetical protein